ncbi:MAG: MFS transporter [Sphingomonadales bacterium]
MAQETKLPVGVKVGWATGAVGVAVLMNGIAALMLFYLTNVVGLAPGVAGTILFLSKVYDAVTDPLSGHLSDKTQGKMGRRRPWLLGGAIISAASFLLVFTVPFEGPFESLWSGEGLATVSYVLVMLLLYTSGYSMFNVPYMAMPAEMTDGYHERSSIHGYRVVFASVGGFAVQTGGTVILEQLGKDWDAYATVALAGSVIILITMLITFWATKHAPSHPQSDVKLPFKEQLRGFLDNTAFQQVLSVKLAQLIGVAASSGGLFFLFVNVLNVPLDQATVSLAFGMMIAVFGGTPILVRLSKIVGKRGGYFISALFTGAAAISWIFAYPDPPYWPLTGGEEPIKFYYWYAVRGFATGIAFSGNVLFAMSMLSDAMEADSHRTGMRREGMYSALYSFIEKLAAAVGPLILGGALQLAGYNPKAEGLATEQVRQAVLVGISYVPASMAIIACIILLFYKLDEDALHAMRRNSSASKPSDDPRAGDAIPEPAE